VWRFIPTDLGGNNLGEPHAYARTLNIGVSKTATASFRIRADDPLWDTIVTDETNLKVYDSEGNLRFYGPIIGDNEEASGQGASVQFVAADVTWNLGKRFTGKDTTGIGTTHTGKDSGQIIYDILDQINGEKDTGVTVGSKDTFVARTTTLLWKNVLAVLTELGAIAGSYEWELRYVDGNPPIAYLDLREQVGGDRTSSVFLEYGTGLLNCKAYSRSRSIERKATRVWALGGNSTLTAAASNAGYETFGRWEDVLTYSDISSAALLDALVAAHVAIRSRSRTLVGLVPFPKTAPKYGVDWFAGDRVNARVVVRRSVRVSGFARIWAAGITIDELGNENPTLVLEPQ
jgi:hypothetical protein